MKKIIFFVFLSTPLFAQFEPSKRWILVDNKIEKREIILQAYDSLLIDYNTMVLTFQPNGTIEYDYESTAEACAGVNFLDIDTDETRWTYNPDNQILTLTVKGGYATLDGFKFKRQYHVERYSDRAYILVRAKEEYYIDLEKLAKKSKK